MKVSVECNKDYNIIMKSFYDDDDVTIIDDVKIIDPTKEDINVNFEVFKMIISYLIGILAFFTAMIQIANLLDVLYFN